MEDSEFKERFRNIEKNMIQENKFSMAKSELSKIIHDAKNRNLSEVLDRARELLRFSNSKEREFSKKIDEIKYLRNYDRKVPLNFSREEIYKTESLIKDQLSKAKNLIHQKKALEAKETLEKVISECKKINEIVNSTEKEHSFSIIFNQAEDLLDNCENFLQNKEYLMIIEQLIVDRKFFEANENLKDLIDEIKTYIGDREILHKGILDKALDISKENSLQDIEKETISKKKLIEETISKAKSLISQKNISEGIKLLENVMHESKSFSKSYSSMIFGQASEIIDYCEDFKNNKNKIIKIEALLKEKKYSTAKNRLQDLIDEIENYIGFKAILNKEILNKALILLRENIKCFPEGYMSEYSEDIILELKKEIEKYNLKTLVKNANSIAELNYYLPKRSDFFNKLYNVFINSNIEYETLFKTELTKLIVQFYTPYLEINPFNVNIQYFPMSFIAWFKNDLGRLQSLLENNDKIKDLCKKLESIDINVMIDKEIEKITKEIKELNYDVSLENMYNFLLDFSQIIIDPNISKTEDSTKEEYTLKTSQGSLYFKIKEKDLNKKLVYDYDFLSSTYGEKGRVFIDFSEPTSGTVILKIKNEIQEISKEKRDQLMITNLLGTYLKQYIDMNLGKIVAKQLQAVIYEKDFDDLTMGNYRILQAKLNTIGKDIDKLKTKYFEVRVPLTFSSFDCSECGATLKITSTKEKFIICEHCDTPFLMEWQKE